MKQLMIAIALLAALVPQFCSTAQAHDLDHKVFAFDFDTGNGVVRTEYMAGEAICYRRSIDMLSAGWLVKPCYELSISEAMKKQDQAQAAPRKKRLTNDEMRAQRND